MLKKIIAFLFSSILALSIVFAQSTTLPPSTTCPGKPGVDVNSSTCVENQIFGNNGIDVTSFFPQLSINDFVGLASTILLSVLVIFLGFKIIIAGYKWVNNDGQDKNKKDAIKSITNGFVGLGLAFGAYFIVLLVRSFFGIGGNEQIVNCANLYYANYDSYETNSNASTLDGNIRPTTPEFIRCVKLSGKYNALVKNFSTFQSKIASSCMQYISISTTSSNLNVNNRQALNSCFVNEIESLP